MGNLRACLAVATIALAACGDDGATTKNDAAVDTQSIDAKIFMDAPPPVFDFSCIGAAAPTVPSTIALSGFAQRADLNGAFQLTLTPIDGGTVTVCETTACNGGGLDEGTSDAAGDWAITGVNTGAVPYNAYLRLVADTNRTTFVYPGLPFTADQAGIPIITLGAGLIGLTDTFGCAANEPIVLVAVTDCANTPITDNANVDIVVKQGGTVVASAEATSLAGIPGAPAEISSLFIVCGVPESDATELSATYNGMPFIAHSVKTVNSTTTATQLTPGY
jgi:hypothetical protein